MRLLSRLVFACLIGATGVLFFGPRPAFDDRITFQDQSIGPDIDAYLDRRESGVPGVRPEARKQVFWRDPARRAPTSVALVYLHGRSAAELAAPEDLVRQTGANLYQARLTGHGRTEAALAEGSVQAWHDDLAEALAIGSRIGERVVVVGAVEGAALALLGAAHPELQDKIAGVALIAPRLGPVRQGGGLLTLPFAETLAPLVLSSPTGDGATSFPASALFPIALVAKAAAATPERQGTAPLLVIRPEGEGATKALTRALGGWRGPVTSMAVGADIHAQRLSARILNDWLDVQTLR